ncbi:hypothetical protein P4604_20930 [Lysinibacillus capsici]|uniref:hypothetical protein n=1 Tax=Lysinibacillus capsici TaxID=2115968 RepID=UPI002E20B922|nr:hypothetical protein [Lysinibacillus capsici]
MSVEESLVVMNRANQEVVIFDGIYTIEISSDVFAEIIGKITMKWMPKPTLFFEGEITENFSCIDKLIKTNKPIEIILPTGYKGKGYVLSFKFGTKYYISGDISEGLIFGKDTSIISSLNFSIVNFIDNFGGAIQTENHTYTGRYIINYKEFKIIIDKKNNYKEIYESLKESGGYCITHECKIQSMDGKEFYLRDVNYLVDALVWLLSFLCGRQIGISYFEGKSNGDTVFVNYQTSIIHNWRNISNWFIKNESQFGLNEIFSKLVEKLNDELWGRVLRNVFTWYFDGMSQAYIETKIVSIQIALENVAWTYIVEKEEILDRQAFDKLRASDKLRLMLYEFKIDRRIPQIEEFNTFNNKYKDGAHLFTELRNDIVHPKKNTQDIDGIVLYNTLHLGIYYLELSILKLLDYKGRYINFFNNANLNQRLEYVPWSNEDEFNKLFIQKSKENS